MYTLFIIISILIIVLFFFTNTNQNKKKVFFNSADWINLVKNKKVDSHENRYYIFTDSADMMIDNTKKVIFKSYIGNNKAIYSNTDYISKFMLVFSNYSNVKTTFIEGYIIEDSKLYYTYAFKDNYYKRLNTWLTENGSFHTEEVWTAKKDIDWKTFPAPTAKDINWEKKAFIGDIISF